MTEHDLEKVCIGCESEDVPHTCACCKQPMCGHCLALTLIVAKQGKERTLRFCQECMVYVGIRHTTPGNACGVKVFERYRERSQSQELPNKCDECGAPAPKFNTLCIRCQKRG